MRVGLGEPERLPLAVRLDLDSDRLVGVGLPPTAREVPHERADRDLRAVPAGRDSGLRTQLQHRRRAVAPDDLLGWAVRGETRLRNELVPADRRRITDLELFSE